MQEARTLPVVYEGLRQEGVRLQKNQMQKISRVPKDQMRLRHSYARLQYGLLLVQALQVQQMRQETLPLHLPAHPPQRTRADQRVPRTRLHQNKAMPAVLRLPPTQMPALPLPQRRWHGRRWRRDDSALRELRTDHPLRVHLEQAEKTRSL